MDQEAGHEAETHGEMVDLPTRGISMRCQLRGSGTPLLLCAGTGYPLDTWPEAFLEPLAAQFRLVLFDYRGTGGTPGTEDPYSTQMFALDAAELLRQLGIPRAHVLGHSMGGRVAQWLALDTPERVDRLVLVASGAGEQLRSGSQEGGIPLHTAVAMIEAGFKGYLTDNVRKLFFPPEIVEERGDLVDAVVEPFWENRPSVQDYLKHVQARQTHFTADRIDKISHPTLILVGERDSFHGRTGSHVDQSKFLAESIPDAQLQTLPDVAHGLFWQAPEATAREVRAWLAAATPR